MTGSDVLLMNAVEVDTRVFGMTLCWYSYILACHILVDNFLTISYSYRGSFNNSLLSFRGDKGHSEQHLVNPNEASTVTFIP